MGLSPPDLKGQEFEVLTPASATPPDKQWALDGLRRWRDKKDARWCGVKALLPPLWVFRRMHASTPPDRMTRHSVVPLGGRVAEATQAGSEGRPPYHFCRSVRASKGPGEGNLPE